MIGRIRKTTATPRSRTIHFLYDAALGVLGGQMSSSTSNDRAVGGWIYWFDESHGYNGRHRIEAEFEKDANVDGDEGEVWRVTAGMAALGNFIFLVDDGFIGRKTRILSSETDAFSEFEAIGVAIQPRAYPIG